MSHSTLKTKAEEAPNEDVAALLNNLPKSGPNDLSTQVTEIYQRTMRVYEPSARAYQTAALQSTKQTIHGLSTSTNN